MRVVDGTSGMPTSGSFGAVTDLEVWWRCEQPLLLQIDQP